MKYLLPAEKDSTITNAYSDLGTRRKVYANMGASDVLEAYVLYGRDASDTYELSRFLLFFDEQKIRSIITKEKMERTKFFLRLTNAPHGHTLPKEFELEFYLMTHWWEEGIGLDMEQYSDEGGVSWKAYKTVPRSRPRPTTYDWVTEGGDFDSTKKKVVFFKEGDEDARVDITDWVNLWLDDYNPYPNHGILVKYPDSYERSDKRNYYTKKFFARKSMYYYFRPYIEILTEESDYINYNYERSHFLKDSSLYEVPLQYLYFINKDNNGNLVDVPGYDSNDNQFYVKVMDINGNAVKDGIRPLRISRGVYRYSLNVPENVNGPYLMDNWYFNYGDEKPFFSGRIVFREKRSINDEENEELFIPRVYIKDLKSAYYCYETKVFEVFATDANKKINIYNSYYQSISKNLYPLYKTYYKVVRKIDDYVVVDFSCLDDVGVEYSKIYNRNNTNYFLFNFGILEPGYMYEFRFMTILDNGDKYEHPEAYKFRVESNKYFRF